MRWFRHRKARGQEPSYFSVLDLGASKVKALVVGRSGGQVDILGRSWVAHRNGLTRDGAVGDQEALRAACERALMRAEDATEAAVGHKIVPDRALVSVPTAWLRGALGWGRMVRPHLEETIARQECSDPIKHAGQQAMQRLAQVATGGEWELVDATVVSLRVDGRRVTDPVGFRGHTLEALALVFAAPREALRAVRQIADSLNLDPPHPVPEPLALSAAVPGDGLILEAGAATTSVVLARHGVPLSFASIRHGDNSLTQSLSEALDVPYAHAEALLDAYGGGRLEESQRQAVSAALEEPLISWLSAVVECARSWDSPPEGWPTTVHLCGGTSRLPELQTLVADVRWLEALPFPHAPSVRLWDGSNLERVVHHAEPRWQLADVTVLSVAGWLLRDRGQSSFDGMLRSSLRLGSVP